MDSQYINIGLRQNVVLHVSEIAARPVQVGGPNRTKEEIENIIK
jgi:hypothetical protein